MTIEELKRKETLNLIEKRRLKRHEVAEPLGLLLYDRQTDKSFKNKRGSRFSAQKSRKRE